MRKMMFSILITVSVFSANALNNLMNLDIPKNEESIMNSAIFIRPFDMANELKDNLYGLCIEAQSAFSSLWGLRTNEDYLFNQDIFIVNLTLGPQINLTNSILEGLMIGIYPGVQFTTSNSYYFQPKILAECTYNYKLNDSPAKAGGFRND